MARDDHYAEVSGVLSQFEELIGIQAALVERLESLSGDVMMVAGESQESARNAAALVVQAESHGRDTLGVLRNAVAELERYAGGF